MGRPLRRRVRPSSLLASRGLQTASTDGPRWTSRRSLDTSMPTKTAEGLSMTLPCECGLGPSDCLGPGPVEVGVNQALSRAFQPKADAG